MNKPSLTSMLGLALIISLVGFAPAPSWAGCKNAGGGGSTFSYGSEVSGSAVAICLNTSSVVPARTSTIAKVVPKSVAKVAAKPMAKPMAKPAPKPVAKALKPRTLADIRALMRVADVPAAKPISLAKPKPVVRPKIVVKTPAKSVSVLSTTPASNSSSNGAAYFSPDESSAAVSPSNYLSVGQSATFFSDPKVHYRLGSVLGKSAEVRFSPIQTTWAFGDGSSAQGERPTHIYSAGSFDVEVIITYSVSYRFAGQVGWVADPGQIEMPATVFVSVADQASPAPPSTRVVNQLPYLVSANCLANWQALGC